MVLNLEQIRLVLNLEEELYGSLTGADKQLVMNLEQVKNNQKTRKLEQQVNLTKPFKTLALS